MKRLLRLAAVSALVAGLSLVPALAQETIATMKVTGTVMTSEGGEFVPAGDSTALQAGERVMITENSSATIAYADGRVETLTKPGVYTIFGRDRDPDRDRRAADESPAGEAAEAGAVITPLTAAIIGGLTAALVTTQIENDGDNGSDPLSR
jgi:hypothetical protein